MSAWLKQSAAATIMLGPFVDSTDGFTAETALTLGFTFARLSKNGGLFAQANDTGSLAHNENGWYVKGLNTTDTNTLGPFKVAVNASGALPVWREFLVVPTFVYDSLVGTAGNLTVDLTSGALNGVHTEVIRSLVTDTFAEPAAVVAATASLKDKLGWLFALARNKMTQTASTTTLRNDADGANISTSTVSDDGTTLTVQEWV